MRPFQPRLLPAPVGGGFAMEDFWVWCGSAARGDDGRYHLFASRWPRRVPFFMGYITRSEVVRAVSATPEGPYTFQEVVLPARGPAYWDGIMTHNPSLLRAGATWLLYYIGATTGEPLPSDEALWRGELGCTHRCYQTIRIGLATAPSLAGPWTRRDQPVLQTRPGQWDGSVVTNPAPCLLPDGRLLLLYRSNTPQGLRLGAARAEHWSAPLERIRDEPVLAATADRFVEDPYVWWEDGCLQLLAKDMTGQITGERHGGVHASSSDGGEWTVHGAAYSRRVRWSDGRETVQGCLERPNLLLQDGRPTHLFAATSDAAESFTARASDFDTRGRTWTLVLPLRD
ncbi:MAG: glycoside hydrolase family protein [Fimbriimonadaceae bacterium]|nr:glycoside hydrolase family protein [Fimbriimonadaceae bacterium]